METQQVVQLKHSVVQNVFCGAGTMVSGGLLGVFLHREALGNITWHAAHRAAQCQYGRLLHIEQHHVTTACFIEGSTSLLWQTAAYRAAPCCYSMLDIGQHSANMACCIWGRTIGLIAVTPSASQSRYN